MGNDCSYYNISDISNYITLKSKKLSMIVGSIKENTTLEKRVPLTPETAKNIIGLGLKVCIETIKINNDSKIFVVKNTSNNMDGSGITIITINNKIAIGNPNGFNLFDTKICAPNVFVKFMTSP